MTDKIIAPMYSTLLVEKRNNGLIIVTLNRPEAGNAVNTEMGTELLDLWTDFVRNHEGLRCVVLTGAGEDAFCAGGDMKQRKGMSEYDWRHQHEIFEQALWTMMECPVPVIAAVNGKAFGGGLEMVLAADFAYGVDSAKLWFPEVMIGILPVLAALLLYHELRVSVVQMKSYWPVVLLVLQKRLNGVFSIVFATQRN